MPSIPKILVVDDESDAVDLVAFNLKNAGFDVISAADGESAIAKAKSQLPDLVILDQNMPGMDGLQTMEQIRALYPNLVVLIASGQSDIEEWDCFKRPMVDVIPKPFTLEEIQTRLAQFFG